MTSDNTNADTITGTVDDEQVGSEDLDSDALDAATLALANSTYKVRGELSDMSGTGVLGRNTASSGVTFGVEGVTDADNEDAAGVRGSTTQRANGVIGRTYDNESNLPKLGGSGLSAGVFGKTDKTDNYGTVGWSKQGPGVLGRTDDADSPAGVFFNSAGGLAVDANGDVDISGSLTHVSLPRYEDLGTVTNRDRASGAITTLFDAGSWQFPDLKTGPSVTTAGSFSGAVTLPDGRVVFAPSTAGNVGIYDPDSDTYTEGPSHGEQTAAFQGAALAPNGKVVFAPSDSDNVGVFDPDTDSYTSGATHGEGDDAFAGAALAPTGDIIFAPHQSDNVGIYDPAADSYTSGPSHGEGIYAFRRCTLVPSGEIVFAPYQAGNVGIYDPFGDSYTSGDTAPGTNGDFNGAAVVPGGTVVFAPYNHSDVGLYDPVDDAYSNGQSLSLETNAYGGAALLPTGEVAFAPRNEKRTAIYDPEVDGVDFLSSAPTDYYASGVTLTRSGKAVLAPDDAGDVPYVDSYAQTPNPRATALHPLFNSS